MNPPTLTQLLPVLQVAIGPVILISGIGLLLLGMHTRYGRTIDRCRELTRRDVAGDGSLLDQQVRILLHRAAILRRAILFATLSALWAALLIITIFIAALLRFDAGWLIGLIFIACLACLIVSLIDSVRDVNHSLTALRLEVGQRS